MKVTIDLAKLLEFHSEHAYDHVMANPKGFRAFMMEFLAQAEDEKKEQNEDWADNHTNYAEPPLVYGDILFDSHDAAELVLKKMKERIKTKGLVTVADYYIFSNQPAAIESTYYNWGWRDLNGAYAFSWLDHGNLAHALKLPEPEHFRG